MFVKISENQSVNLKNIAIINFKKSKAFYQSNAKTSIVFEPGITVEDSYGSKAVSLKTYIRMYNAAGGRFHWLLNDVAINLEKISGLTCDESSGRIRIAHGDQIWTSDPITPHSVLKGVYDDYLKAVNLYIDRPHRHEEFNREAEKKSPETSYKRARYEMDRMIGCTGAKLEIAQNLAQIKLENAKKDMNIFCDPVMRHMVYLGNPGTGKTTFARKVAALYHAAGVIQENKVIEVTRKDLVAQHVGHTAPKTDAVIQKAKGGILFIDEAYDLFREEDNGNDFGIEVINTLVPAMENMRNDLLVIFAGYHDKILTLLSSNPGLESRTPNVIKFDDYNLSELGEIMKLMLTDRGIFMTEESLEKANRMIEDNKKNTPIEKFGNARTVRNLVEKAEKAMAVRLQESGDMPSRKLSAEERQQALTILPGDLVGITLDLPKPIVPKNSSAPSP